MTNFNKIIIYSLLVFFVLLIIEDVADAKRSSSKVEKVKERSLREEKRHLKKEGKKIKKSFSKKLEQIYYSLCPDCYSKLLAASDSCTQNYEKLNLTKENVEKCKEKSVEKLKKKKRKHFDNSIDDLENVKAWRDIYQRETKMMECLFDQLKEQDKYRNLTKDEFKKERNNLAQNLLKEKTDCIKKVLQNGNSLPESSTSKTEAK